VAVAVTAAAAVGAKGFGGIVGVEVIVPLLLLLLLVVIVVVVESSTTHRRFAGRALEDSVSEAFCRRGEEGFETGGEGLQLAGRDLEGKKRARGWGFGGVGVGVGG
jgi:hypothetical protein